MVNEFQESGVDRSPRWVWLWCLLELVGAVLAVYLLVVWWGTGDLLKIAVAGSLTVSCTARFVLDLRRVRARKSVAPPSRPPDLSDRQTNENTEFS